MKKRVVFLGTPDFAKTHLEALIASDVFDVVGVVSQPDRPSGRKMKLQKSPVRIAAESTNIPVITPESLKKQPEALETILSWKPEALIVVAFGQLLPKSYLDAFSNKVVNVHGSLLPRWRGAAPIQRAIMAGDKVSGVSLQVMVEALDAGDIIGEREIKLSSHMTAIDLHEAMKDLGVELLLTDFVEYLNGSIQPKAQDESLVTYAKKIEKSEALIDWNLPAEQIYNHYRGLQLGPGVRTFHNGKSIKFNKIQLVSVEGHSAPMGSVQKLANEGIQIQCNPGLIEVLELQPESKKRMSVADFLKGYSLSEGDIFGSQ